MSRRIEIRVTGFGGQGAVSAGQSIARAVVLGVEGLDAVFTQAYGPEKTGGWARGDVVIADGEVEYPLVDEPDIFVALSQDGFLRDGPTAKPDALFLIDADLVDPGDTTGHVVHRIPATRTAESLGKRVVANNVMLGAFAVITAIVAPEVLLEAILAAVPRGTESLNRSAFEAGVALARDLARAPAETSR
jgi:2-oxoglutarate ferredoxin oxidoreductase subunit gamma